MPSAGSTWTEVNRAVTSCELRHSPGTNVTLLACSTKFQRIYQLHYDTRYLHKWIWLPENLSGLPCILMSGISLGRLIEPILRQVSKFSQQWSLNTCLGKLSDFSWQWCLIGKTHQAHTQARFLTSPESGHQVHTWAKLSDFTESGHQAHTFASCSDFSLVGCLTEEILWAHTWANCVTFPESCVCQGDCWACFWARCLLPKEWCLTWEVHWAYTWAGCLTSP